MFMMYLSFEVIFYLLIAIGCHFELLLFLNFLPKKTKLMERRKHNTEYRINNIRSVSPEKIFINEIKNKAQVCLYYLSEAA